MLHIESDTDIQFQRLTKISKTLEILFGAEILTQTSNQVEQLTTPLNSQGIFNKIDKLQHSISMESLDLENNLLCIESNTDIQLQNLTTISNTASNVQEISNQTNKMQYEYQEFKSRQLLQILRRFHNLIQTVHQTRYGINIAAGRKKTKLIQT